MDAVDSRARLAELCTRHIVPKAAFIDLLYLFAPRRMTLEAYAPEYFDRMKVIALYLHVTGNVSHVSDGKYRFQLPLFSSEASVSL